MSPLRLLVLTLGAQFVAVVLQTWVINNVRLGVLDDVTVPVILTLSMAATVALSGALTWAVVRAKPRSRVVGGVLLLVGLAFAFAWPIGFLLALETPDVLATWAMGAALPTWQGLVSALIGAYALGASSNQNDSSH
ncbi:MAG TPA: hypothetical protein VK821_01470 [Dehalococcoidia bacterium]|nr:hypothetical protein [Dehalococcoidia bacterium]